MRPVKFTVKNGITYFHYQFSELRKFVKRGLEYGDVGPILVKRAGNMLTYKGFGTIEHPNKEMQTLSIKHFEPFDGKMPTDEERIMVRKENQFYENLRLVILNLSGV